MSFFFPGFADALEEVGWLSADDELTLPNFDRHNGKTAKTRAQTKNRVEVLRSERNNCNAASVTTALPEKRREEKRRLPPISPPEGDGLIQSPTPGELEAIYNLYPRKEGKPTALRAIEKKCKKFGFEYVLEKTRQFASTCDKPNQFIPMPATFYNQERFNDAPETWKHHEDTKPNTAQHVDRAAGTANANVVDHYAGL